MINDLGAVKCHRGLFCWQHDIEELLHEQTLLLGQYPGVALLSTEYMQLYSGDIGTLKSAE